MVRKDLDDDFTFSIEGKDYTISEKKKGNKDEQKQTLHAPSLTIGAIISVICIAIIFFGIEGVSEPSEPLIERQLIEESKKPLQVTTGTFFDNGSPILGDPNAVKGGMLTMVGGSEYPTTFRDVGKDSRYQINSLMSSIQYESLLRFDYETLTWEPKVATHWKISEDKLTYWFRIDPRARWSDDREIISNDVVAAMRLLTDDGHEDPNVAGYYTDLFHLPVADSKYVVKITAKKIIA